MKMLKFFLVVLFLNCSLHAAFAQFAQTENLGFLLGTSRDSMHQALQFDQCIEIEEEGPFSICFHNEPRAQILNLKPKEITYEFESKKFIGVMVKFDKKFYEKLQKALSAKFGMKPLEKDAHMSVWKDADCTVALHQWQDRAEIIMTIYYNSSMRAQVSLY